jgi:preprotein translocase subunit SecA
LRSTLTVDLELEAITRAEDRSQVVDAVIERVRELYDKREINYPVDFNMELAQSLMGQDPDRAMRALLDLANTRYGLGWDAGVIRSKSPQQVDAELREASSRFHRERVLDRAVEEAASIDDAEALEAHVREKYGRSVPHWMKRLKDEEFTGLTRALIEGILRPELVQFERFVLLEVLDPAWKDHLYQMDQLRESVGFRAFSQKDPRIEYKREGANLYRAMTDRLHERMAEVVFRMRLSPQVAAQQGAARRRPAAPPQPQRQPQQRAGGLPDAAGGVGGGIVGPGFGG